MKIPVLFGAAIVSLLILAGCSAKEPPESRELFGEEVVPVNEEAAPSDMKENRILGSVQDLRVYVAGEGHDQAVWRFRFRSCRGLFCEKRYIQGWPLLCI